MKKIKYFLGLATIAFAFLLFGSTHTEAADFLSSTSFSSDISTKLSPIVDKVRDTQGNPIIKDKNYKLQIFRTDASKTTPYYMYNSYAGSAYNWFWLTTNSAKGVSVQLHAGTEIVTNGNKNCIIHGENDNGEVVRFQHDSSYGEGGLYLGGRGHSDRYGFRRIEGDRVYRYLLICNGGGIFANFSSGSITTLSKDEIFFVSFVKV